MSLSSSGITPSGIFNRAGLFDRAGIFNTFSPFSLNPFLYYDARSSMIVSSEHPNLYTTADFLELVPTLRNLAIGSNKGGDATQSVALNQPKALPLINNPAGKLGGYLYIPDVAGNYAEGPSVTIGSNQTWEGELDMVVTQWGSYVKPMGGGNWDTGFGMLFYADGYVRSFSKGSIGTVVQSGVTLGTSFNAKFGFDGTNLYVDIDGVRKFTSTAPSQAGSITHNLRLNSIPNIGTVGNYAIQKAKLTVNNAVVFDCDFNGSTSIRHGDTKFQAAVGGPVTINQSGNDPATIIKKSVLRFDGLNTGLRGLFNQTITEGYMFAAFSVLGDGGDASGRLFEVSSDDAASAASSGIFVGQYGNTGNIAWYNAGWNVIHDGLFDDANGDILHEFKFANGSQVSRVNNADTDTRTASLALSSEEFAIGMQEAGATNAAIDLEYLALFPATITDDQATQIRNYINNRNNVFYRWDTDGYYFFDPQGLSSGAVTTWNGRIVGSDNGDADKNATQSTSADQPTSDGYKVTFADNTDHFDITSTTQAGWQVVGTSLGTFAYRVNANTITELNLLGNLGNVLYRKSGDLYGIILLPTSATGREINEAKKLLTDRGASASATAVVENAWRNRADIVQFDGGDMSDVTNAAASWMSCSSLKSFSTELPLATGVSNAWRLCSSLESFSSDLPSVTNAGYSWYNCTSLTDFSVDVFANWNPSSIASGVFNLTWANCTSLTAQSVENILTSIDASGHYATTNKLSGGTPLADAGIDIDYDGSGLTAATTAAITSLKSKGWSIFINSVEQ